jgi:hypothetical protein
MRHRHISKLIWGNLGNWVKFGVWSLEFGVRGLEFGVWCLEFGVVESG